MGSKPAIGGKRVCVSSIILGRSTIICHVAWRQRRAGLSLSFSRRRHTQPGTTDWVRWTTHGTRVYSVKKKGRRRRYFQASTPWSESTQQRWGYCRIMLRPVPPLRIFAFCVHSNTTFFFIANQQRWPMPNMYSLIFRRQFFSLLCRSSKGLIDVDRFGPERRAITVDAHHFFFFLNTTPHFFGG